MVIVSHVSFFDLKEWSTLNNELGFDQQIARIWCVAH